MGKIRIKTLGLAEEEKKEREKAKVRKEARQGKKTAKAPGLKGGERVVAMAPTEEELAAIPTPPPEEEIKEAPPEVKEKAKVSQPKKRGKKYQGAAKLVDKSRLYPLQEAVELVKKMSFTRFDGSVEVHIATAEKGVAGEVHFPHSTGKKRVVAVADDKILSEIEAGKINFDLLVATPQFMPKLAKFAKVLGPRGLMPNPKAGTVTEEPEKVVEKFKKGGERFKTETQAPLIHLVIGKVSFPKNYLEENLKALISAIGPDKIKKLTLSSTMGPGIKVDLTTVQKLI